MRLMLSGFPRGIGSALALGVGLILVSGCSTDPSPFAPTTKGVQFGLNAPAPKVVPPVLAPRVGTGSLYSGAYGVPPIQSSRLVPPVPPTRVTLAHIGDLGPLPLVDRIGDPTNPLARYVRCRLGRTMDAAGAHLAVAMCINTAERTVLLPHAREPAILHQLQTWRVALAQQVDDGTRSERSAYARFMDIRTQLMAAADVKEQKEELDAEHLMLLNANATDAQLTQNMFLASSP